MGLAVAEEPEILRRIGTVVGDALDRLSNGACRTVVDIENAARRAAGAPPITYVCGG